MQFARPPKLTWLRYRPGRTHNYCGLCGGRDPVMFDVPTTVWQHYVEAEQRHQMVCLACWRRLTEIVDGGQFEADHGGPVALWSPEWRERHGIAEDERRP